MAFGAITDDNSVWPEDQPNPSAPAPAPSDPYNGYWIPRILANLYQSAKSGFTLPGDVATGKASMADPQTQARVGDMTGLVMGGGLAGPSEADMTNMGFRLYHGTPKYFEKPSTAFINTGQGAQTYGWGLYGAQAEGVAKDMRDQLISDPGQSIAADIRMGGQVINTMGATPDDISRGLMGLLDRNPYTPANRPDIRSLVLRAMHGYEPGGGTYSSDGLQALRQLKEIIPPPPKGHMQEWEVNADPSHFLDWTALHDEQSQHVTDALHRSGFWPDLEEHLINDDKFGTRNPTGSDIYRWFAEDYGPKETSQELLKQGIPGIKVLDQSSRRNAKLYGILESDPQLTRNFVIPDENLIKVIRHYNAAGVPGLLGQMAAPSLQTQGQ